MSGVEVRDPDVNAMLMAQKRDTMPAAFKRQGYRAIALMPGLWQAWPEAGSTGSMTSTAVRGSSAASPGVRLVRHPDQYAREIRRAKPKMDADRRRPPLFMFFPTISTHTPFGRRRHISRTGNGLTDTPSISGISTLISSTDGLAEPRSATSMPWRTYATLTGYLQTRDRDFVMILLGDHSRRWSAARARRGYSGARDCEPAMLDRLVTKGFKRGIAVPSDLSR